MKGLELYLTYVDYDRVEYDAYVEGRRYQVSVINGRFPHAKSDSGASLGDDQLDCEVVMRANEETARFRCYRINAA